MNNKGFTLIELLAVIVIITIIALISTPIILGVIEKVELSSIESSALGYINAVENQIVVNQLDTSKQPIVDGTNYILDLNNNGVSVKGNEPSDNSWVYIKYGQVTDCSLKINDYTINCVNTEKKVRARKGDNLNDAPII